MPFYANKTFIYFVLLFLIKKIKKEVISMDKLFISFALLFLVSGVFAIQPAESWNIGAIGRYTQIGQANVTTQGGNVTNLNLSGNMSTDKWAGFWGNVSGGIVLSSGTNIFYSWAWTPAMGGEVCAIAAPSGFSWTGIQAITAAAVNSVWNFGAATDNATNTYKINTCAVNVAGTAVTNTAGNTTGVGGFTTCAVADQAVPTTKADLAFCVNITQNGNLFNGQPGNYELLVPTNSTLGSTETYYFWVELD